MTNSIPFQTIAGISPAISKIYDVSVLETTVGSLAHSFSYIIMVFPASYVIDKKGIKIGTLACTFKRDKFRSNPHVFRFSRQMFGQLQLSFMYAWHNILCYWLLFYCKRNTQTAERVVFR